MENGLNERIDPEIDRRSLLLGISELLCEEGLISETEKNRMKSIINGNEGADKRRKEGEI